MGARAFGYDSIAAETIGNLLDDNGTQVGDWIVTGLDCAGGALAPAEVAPDSNLERYGCAIVQGAVGMGVGAWTRAEMAKSLSHLVQRRMDTGFAVRIMRLSTWMERATSPA